MKVTENIVELKVTKQIKSINLNHRKIKDLVKFKLKGSTAFGKERY